MKSRANSLRAASGAVALVLAACVARAPAKPSPAPSLPVGPSLINPGVVGGSLEAFDQTGDGTTLLISKVTIHGAAGWVVIHQDYGGPEQVLGHAGVPEGTSENVVVHLDRKVPSGVYWVMLHRDAGKLGVFEWPGRDGPVRAPQGIAYVLRKVVLTVR